MRTSSIWDPVELISSASCSLGIDRDRKGPSRQGKWGHVVDIRYLINLGASGEEENGICLRRFSLINFPLRCFTLRVNNVEEGGSQW